jgi:hypothetical protein
MSEFLLNVARRGAGLPAAVSPRRPPRDAELPADPEPLAVEAEAAPGVATDDAEPPSVAEPRLSEEIPRPVPAVRPGPERARSTRMTADRPQEPVIALPRASRVERSGDGPSLLPVAPAAGDVSPAVPSTMPASVAPTTPAVPPATTEVRGEPAARPPAPPTVRPTWNGPRPDPIDSRAAPAPGPPPVRELAAEERALPADLPADDPILAPVRLLPATAPVAWPVADPAPAAPHVDVRIGRIEILPPPAAAPPLVAPRRQPRGFAAETSSRSYRDRRWY